MTLAQASERLAEIGHDFHRRGWALGTSGNFSVVLDRDPLTLAITASSIDKSRMTPDQILCVDGQGRPLEGFHANPSAETLLHVAVAQALGVGAVLHTHSVWSTVLSDYHSGQAGFFIEGYEMLKGLAGISTHEHKEWMPILENSQDLGLLSRQATLLMLEQPDLHGFIIRRHGLYTWGAGLDEAIRHVEILEFLLEAVGRTTWH